MCPHHDAPDSFVPRLDVLRGLGPIERLEGARERLLGWREALEAAGFRTNLSLMPPCSLAARRGDESDERWVTVLPTGLVALERRDLGETASTWSRVTDRDGEPTVDDVVRAIRALFARTASRTRAGGQGVGSNGGATAPGVSVFGGTSAGPTG